MAVCLKIMALLKSQIFHATKVTILNPILVKENETDHDHDLKNIKQTALNGGLSKDHDSTQERDLPCNTSHDLGSQTSKDN